MSETENKYQPFNDVDGNGTIIITPLDLMKEKRLDDQLYLNNISGAFNGKGLADTTDAERSVRINLRNMVGSISSAQIETIVGAINDLYSNKIDCLSIENLPGLTYQDLCPVPLDQVDGALQWERTDLDGIISHIRLLYTPATSH
jgi:hypothetical protein